MGKITLYHGTPDKLVIPKYGGGNEKHDYGKGFYLTVQYLHSYAAKSIPNRLRRWDFALLNHFLTVSAVNASTCTE